MADLAVIEKAPGYRLDHPDWGVVGRVSYAKGTITEVQKLQDAPIKMASKVKVKVADEKSDLLPLFYRPKKQYWDTPEHQAQDINQAEKLYENAWMSFRGDDEVKVVLVEGKPVAVLGFADHIRRIGEDIIKIYTEQHNGESHNLHLQCSKKGKQYLGVDANSIGPDNVDLGLAKEAALICDSYIEEDTFIGCKTINQLNISCGDPNACYAETSCQEYYYREWLVVVGPIMYIFQCWANDGRDYIEQLNGCISVTTGFTNYLRTTSPFSILAAPYSQELYDATVALGGSNSNLNAREIDENWHSIGDRGYWLDYPGFVYQEEFTMNIFNNINLNRMWADDETAFDITKFALHIRPHTKAELQAAGMWPGSN